MHSLSHLDPQQPPPVPPFLLHPLLRPLPMLPRPPLAPQHPCLLWFPQTLAPLQWLPLLDSDAYNLTSTYHKECLGTIKILPRKRLIEWGMNTGSVIGWGLRKRTSHLVGRLRELLGARTGVEFTTSNQVYWERYKGLQTWSPQWVTKEWIQWAPGCKCASSKQM